ncbi:hypothetical protein D9M09_14605 [Janthinobacterium agaricidamnosum]|uniref:Putative tail fiber protein gp53-like C-terminal domain-containing protein n=1 Tax=Janthinobacterium agaricidamnosum TaxID=55508 RepID=A0A3G2E9I6_9BURK|nr:hypothetical protein D9M09_14605 [Janthinobacterium agaricidamnosum]
METDLLGTNKNTMIALAKLTETIIGTATTVSGLGCAPNSPAALNVVISPGEIYSLQNIDGTAYSSIAADTAHSIMKQGILLDSVTLACAAPGTAGQSINYLIQAAFSEVDSGAVVLPYYNASNPSTAYSGPGGAGTTNNTVRDGTVALSAKAGIAAVTGSQVTPAADAGYVGLWVVTVANGQTTINAGNIAKAIGAPFSGTAAMLNVMNAFTVSPTAPTPPAADNSTKVATTGWFYNAIATVAVAMGFAVSLTPNGYIKFPSWLGSLIFQWGLGGTADASGVSNAIFTTAFPNEVLHVISFYQPKGATPASQFTGMATGAITLAGCKIFTYIGGAPSGGSTPSYFAVGR